MSSEKRQYDRYPKELELSFDFRYDAAAKLKYQVADGVRHVKKYAGISKNICASGLCLTSHHKLEKGQHVHLELSLPRRRQPIRMDGEVCWCDSAVSDAKKTLYDAGIKLQAVEGEAVDATVHLDEAHHVLWSNVLEAVFGTFRKIVQAK